MPDTQQSPPQDPPQSSFAALAVVRPFGSYRIGDLITDPAEITRLMACEQAVSVVRVHLPAER